jgi:hypothetical protein
MQCCRGKSCIGGPKDPESCQTSVLILVTAVLQSYVQEPSLARETLRICGSLDQKLYIVKMILFQTTQYLRRDTSYVIQNIYGTIVAKTK